MIDFGELDGREYEAVQATCDDEPAAIGDETLRFVFISAPEGGLRGDDRGRRRGHRRFHRGAFLRVDTCTGSLRRAGEFSLAAVLADGAYRVR